jgi:hypothetical protein
MKFGFLFNTMGETQAVERGKGLHIWTITAHILKNQLWTILQLGDCVES